MKANEKDDFIFEVTIIKPLTDIIKKLENKEFRTCDINWLNKKLNQYVELALEILGKNINTGKAIDGIMNDYNNSRFLNYFRTLLNFFKQY